MKLWFISMGIVSSIGVLAYFIWAKDPIEIFLSGFLFGAPLGALYLRVLVHKWLKPEYFTDDGKEEYGKIQN